MSDLPTWTRPDSFKVVPHQRLVDKANVADRVIGSDDIDVADSGYGKSVHYTGRQLYQLQAIAKIIAPEDESYVYSDPRYRLQIQKIIYGANSEDIIKLANEDDISEQQEAGSDPENSVEVDEEILIPPGWTVTATNLVEITDPTTGSGTHSLPEDGTIVVEIKCYYDKVDGKVSEQRWVFSSGGVGEDGPEFDGMVHRGVANLTKGWALLNYVNIEPE